MHLISAIKSVQYWHKYNSNQCHMIVLKLKMDYGSLAPRACLHGYIKKWEMASILVRYAMWVHFVIRKRIHNYIYPPSKWVCMPIDRTV